MKNMKIRAKLFTGFIIVTIIGVLVGILGIVAISMIQKGSEDTASLQDASSGASNVLNAHYIWRHNLTEAVLTGSGFTGSLDSTTCALGKWLDSDEARGITDTQILDLLRQVEEPHHFIHTEARTIVELLEAGNAEEATDLLVGTILPRTQEVIANLTEVQNRFDTIIDEESENLITLETTFRYIIIAFIAVAVIVSILLALYISNLISKPLIPLNAFMARAGTTGNLTLGPADEEVIGKFALIKDEIGQTIRSCASFVSHVTNISEALTKISNGDLTIDIESLSSEDTLGNGLQRTMDNLNNMFGEINSASSQVSTGSKQIADSSQMLAQGSTQQAAAVQELSASIANIAQKTKDNSDKADHAANLANTIKGNAEKGSYQMDEMITAVKDINTASQSISRVIKVIDDIAFQTNILALNAAVEAARAGQHGKGFAVVAEEVRNLAAKSAEAAKETGVLIQNSSEKAGLGSRIASDTAASLTEIVSGINESSKIVGEIAYSSLEQSQGIEQINKGIDQVAQVVQQNSATAEESAAASEEMSAQSTTLQGLISQFKLKDENMVRSLPSNGETQRLVAISGKDTTNDGGYGKY